MECEPELAVAVVGLSARLPGAASPEEFWRMLAGAGQAETTWPGTRPGQTTEPAQDGVGFKAALLDRIDAFDASFFGISPREATQIDPQQRLMLELAWEALEDAAILPGTLHGARAGVFVGSIADDYAVLLARRGSDGFTQHSLTGTTRGIIANRISYFLGLRGPSMVVDSAQASSLVAVHLACQSLTAGECTLALAGGVNLIVDPDNAAKVASFGGLSPDGRCYTFDARANGYLRGEGGGFVALKPLGLAVADGDRIYCVIRGSAVNNDGATDGLTVPSRAAQEEVIRAAGQRAATRAAEVQYVELHGTGTRVGDPIEAAALGAAYGTARPDGAPLAVGSAKTNVGHLEGASGIVGLIKTALSVSHRQLPASLNFETPNPQIPLETLNLAVQRDLGPWPSPDRPLIAGVSSFGMGGTNCHVVVQEAPGASAPAPAPAGSDAPGTMLPWPVSGRSDKALRAQARRLREHLDTHDELTPADVGWSLATGRTAFESRAVVLGRDRDALVSALGALAQGQPRADLISGISAAGPVKLAMLFTGAGPQYLGMGRELCAAYPTFGAAFAAACEHLDPHLPVPLRDVVFAPEGSPDAEMLNQTWYSQVALFALETAMFRLLESWGVRADYVIGHSVGEVAAAHAAGVLSLPDAATLVAVRGRMMSELSGGAMVSIAASEDEVRASLPDTGRVVVGVVNGPKAVTIAGDEDAVLALAAEWEGRGRKAKRLRISLASHSPHMDAMIPAFTDVTRGLTLSPARIPVASNITGRIAAPQELCDPEYWPRHVRGTVRFADGIAALAQAGVTVYLELGPGGVLTGMAADCLAGTGEAAPTLISTLRRDRDEQVSVLSAVAQLHVSGGDVDWDKLFAPHTPRRVPLPGYAFQRRRYWPTLGEAPVVAGMVVSVPGDDDEVDETVSSALAGQDEAAQRSTLLELIRTHAAVVLGHESSDGIENHRSFRDMGFDSPLAVELGGRLAGATGRQLPTSLVFDYPTPNGLARFLATSLGGGSEPRRRGRRVAGRGEDPVVITGMACRFPGEASSPEELWRLLLDERDAIGPFPANRGWDIANLYDPSPEADGKTYTQRGGFLYDADQFDNDFFGISPREALAIDPQQRLILELSWEVLERAGIDAENLREHPTGVFVGAMSTHYGPALDQAQGDIGGYLLTGTSGSVTSGRVAYTLGLEGPAVTIDTACSSSLVAVHLAAQSLRNGECDLALAGGVTIMTDPGMFVEFSRQRGLAPDGRCKPFAAAADGTAWGEGAGVLLLERLSDARAAGRTVLAVIRGSAINSDGASNGLTAPNGPSQQRLIRAAWAAADLTGNDIDVVEAHGTGTSLGDPIEAQALAATYGRDRDPARPLQLGAVKSNIGHTQAAAGIAGIIKMTQALNHGVLPATLNIDAPTPHADWTAGTIALTTAATPWPEVDRPRRAAVSSFGISGTNAHLILEQAPAFDVVEAAESSDAPPWVLSAKTPAALQALAAGVAAWVAAHPDARAASIAATLSARTRHSYRAAVTPATAEGYGAALAALAAGTPHPELTVAHASRAPKTAFIFPGQGSQWDGMARDLLVSSPAFAAHMTACDAAMAPHTGWSLLDVLQGGPGTPPADRVDVVQPVLFAVMTGLARLWEDAGVHPDAVLGHSQGEIAAAYIAGALTLEDAAKVVTLRSKALIALAGTGAMASVPLPAAAAADRFGAWAGRLHVAAANGPAATVISGDPDAIAALVAACNDEGIKARAIPVDYASHSPHIDALQDEILLALADISPRPGRIPIYSATTGEPIDGAALTPEYWHRSLRQPVQFQVATEALLADGHTLLIETSPHPVLTVPITDTIAGYTVAPGAPVPVTLGTLRRGDGTPARLRRSLAQAHAYGTPGFSVAGQHLDLPTYPFQRQRYWITAPAGRDNDASGLSSTTHPMLGAATELPDGTLLLTGRLAPHEHPWLADHTVHGAPILPGTAYAEMMLHAGERSGTLHVEELTLRAPLHVPEHIAASLQIVASPADEGGRRAVTARSRPADAADDVPWLTHATGVLAPAPDVVVQVESDGSWLPDGAVALDVDSLYEDLGETGLSYGPAFRGLRAAWRHGEDVWAELELVAEVGDHGYGLHPATFDAALHATFLLSGRFPADGAIPLPFAWAGIQLHAGGGPATRVKIGGVGHDSVTVELADDSGRLVASVTSLVFRTADASQLRQAVSRPDILMHLDWVPVGTSDTVAAGPLAVLASHLDVADLGLAADATSYPSLADLIADAGEGYCGTVLAVLPGLEAGADPDGPAARGAARRVLALAQQWLAAPALAGARLVAITRGAVTTGPADGAADLIGATTWGLLRSAQTEAPGQIFLLDLDPAGSVAPGLVARALATGAPQAALRGTAVLVPQLARHAPVAASASWFDPDGTVLITGGTGTLGALLARHLTTTHGARHLVLASRRGLEASGAGDLIAELAELGAEATVAACDLTDSGSTALMLAAIPGDHPLTAVIHAAGTLDDAIITELTPDQLDNAMRPKADAAWNLHRLTAGQDLLAFVMFSSLAGTLGTPGQGNYAAGNAYLDALAHQRRAAGLPAVSLAWGLWEQDSGMTAHLDATDRNRLTRLGVLPIPTEVGLAAFDTAVAGGDITAVAAQLDLAQLRSRAESGLLHPIYRGLVGAPAKKQKKTGGADGGAQLSERLATLNADEGRELLLGVVREHAALVLGHGSASAIDTERGFLDAGFDSLTAVDLRNLLTTTTGLRMSPTLLFDYPTPTALAGFLHAELGGGQAAEPNQIFAEIDKLESRLREMPSDTRRKMAVRLEEFVLRLGDNTATADNDAPAAAETIKSATDDEIFAFLDKELGIS